MLVSGAREAMVTAPTPTPDCSIALLPQLPGFPPLAFPTTISSLTSPQSVSPQSTAALALGLLHNPLAPSCCPFQETSISVWGMYGRGKVCQSFIPFRLPQISCFTLGLKCFSSDSDNCPCMGMGTLLQFPHLPRAGPLLLTLLFFPLVPSFTEFCVVLYILFHWSGTLLSAGVLHALLCLKVYSWCICVLHVHLLLHHLVLYMSVLYWSFISAKTYYVYLVYNFAFKDTGDWLLMIQLISTYIVIIRWFVFPDCLYLIQLLFIDKKDRVEHLKQKSNILCQKCKGMTLMEREG